MTSKKVKAYESQELNEYIMEHIQNVLPAVRSLAIILGGPFGSGKSTVMASYPIPNDKQRIVVDMEDSMKALDGGEEGTDIYLPHIQRFRMKRITFPTIEQIARAYQYSIENPDDVGVFVIDNIKLFQDALGAWFIKNCMQPKVLNDTLTMFNAPGQFNPKDMLPPMAIVRKWGTDGPGYQYWAVAKAIPRAIMLGLAKAGINFIGSSHEGLKFEQGRAVKNSLRLKVWDEWINNADMALRLERDIKRPGPPTATLYKGDPKQRLQGWSPSFQMDWSGFAKQAKVASDRFDAMLEDIEEYDVPDEPGATSGAPPEGLVTEEE